LSVTGDKITDPEIRPLLDRFYSRVREDDELGPIFNCIVADWDEHLGRIEEFWSSVMLTTGRYKGNPIAIHLLHVQKIRPEMFSRWLHLWRQTTDEMLSQVVAREMQAKARRIAERLAFVMHGSLPDDLTEEPGTKPDDAAPEPYRVTPVFDETTTPSALTRAHSTKAGVWGLIRIATGRLQFHPDDTGTPPVTLDSTTPGLIRPQQTHHLDLLGPVRFQVEFYDRDPSAAIHAPQ